MRIKDKLGLRTAAELRVKAMRVMAELGELGVNANEEAA